MLNLPGIIDAIIFFLIGLFFMIFSSGNAYDIGKMFKLVCTNSRLKYVTLFIKFVSISCSSPPSHIAISFLL